MIDIVGLGGSLAPQSASLSALNVALTGAQEYGASVQLFDLRELNLPMYVPGAPLPDAARRLCDATYAAHGMLWSSPLYHGTISGAFKNALDWLQLLGDRTPPYLTDKVVGLISTAGGTHGLQAVNAWSSSCGRSAGGRCRWCCPFPRRCACSRRDACWTLASSSNCARSATSSPARRSCSGRRR